ncbi:MAG: hypothetical protein C0501_04640 [Isosphaera sp.]|nr:hypothetical protein [Isosphaera sp.]
MGHVRLGPLPATRKWDQVVALIGGGAAAAQLATATMTAAERGLKAAADDPGVLEAVWLLVRIPLAARSPDFTAALRKIGLDVPDGPGLVDVAVALTAAVDTALPDGRGRTDLGEMAQTAAVETVNATVGPRAASLWGAGPDEVRAAFAALATPAQFGALARRFFARFAFKYLNYFVSKALPRHVGEGERFRTVAEQSRFTDALRTHCHEATKVVEVFAGEWFSKHRYESGGDITREEARGFLGYAVAVKLTGEFLRREGRRGA